MVIQILMLSLLSMICYRLGGMGDDGRKKFPKLPKWFFNTKARDIGCGLCVIASFYALGLLQGIILWKAILCTVLCIPLHLGALSTYFDFINGEDNFWLHGFVCGLAIFPLIIITGLWWQFALRSFVLAILMGGISALSGNDNVEEFSRGGVLPFTMLLLIL